MNSDFTPFFFRNSCVPSVAIILKPNDSNRLAGSNIPALSRLATVIKTVPLIGSGVLIAYCDLKKAMPNELANPSTSPVDLISGPNTGSTSGNILNGNTASFTPK
jgi:hypothetical protein